MNKELFNYLNVVDQNRDLNYYKNMIKDWVEFDARQVVVRGDTRGKWARIRLDTLTELRNPMFYEDRELAPQLYQEYIKLLNNEIDKLNGGKKSWGDVPVFRYSRKARQKARKLAVTLV